MKNTKSYNLDKATKKELKQYGDSILKSIEAIAFIDFMHKTLGWNRQERRGFWSDFIKSPAYRSLYLESLMQEIAGR